MDTNYVPAHWTIDGFENMTAQEVFDLSASHLLRQGKKCQNAKGRCIYDGPEGTTCAAGVFLRPEYRAFGDTGFSKQWKHLVTSGNAPEIHQDLVSALQGIHDTYNNPPSSWPELLRKLAVELSLSPAVLG